MKDLKQKYGSVDEEELEDDDLELRRQGKDMKMPANKEIDELAASVYQFLYSGDSDFDIDGLFQEIDQQQLNLSSKTFFFVGILENT